MTNNPIKLKKSLNKALGEIDSAKTQSLLLLFSILTHDNQVSVSLSITFDAWTQSVMHFDEDETLG